MVAATRTSYSFREVSIDNFSDKNNGRDDFEVFDHFPPFFVQILTWIMMMMMMIRMVMYCISQEVGASDTEPGCLEMLILILI